MKLYTEEQLENTVNAIQYYIIRYGIDSAQERIIKHVKALQPIELPTDEEIENISSEIPTVYDVAWEAGAKWVLEQIKNEQNERNN